MKQKEAAKLDSIDFAIKNELKSLDREQELYSFKILGIFPITWRTFKVIATTSLSG